MTAADVAPNPRASGPRGPRPSRDRVIASLFIVLGVVTALPATALVTPEVLSWTYGVAPTDPMIVALLQHRGVLQLALGAAIVWAGLRPALRVAVAATAIVTKSTFLALLLPDPSMRQDLASFSLWFDSLCIVFFAIYVAAALQTRRRGKKPERGS